MTTVDSAYDPLQEAQQIREQLASHTRRLAFFLGAGTSMSVGAPGLESLTEYVSKALPEDMRKEPENSCQGKSH